MDYSGLTEDSGSVLTSGKYLKLSGTIATIAVNDYSSATSEAVVIGSNNAVINFDSTVELGTGLNQITFKEITTDGYLDASYGSSIYEVTLHNSGKFLALGGFLKFTNLDISPFGTEHDIADAKSVASGLGYYSLLDFSTYASTLSLSESVLASTLNSYKADIVTVDTSDNVATTPSVAKAEIVFTTDDGDVNTGAGDDVITIEYTDIKESVVTGAGDDVITIDFSTSAVTAAEEITGTITDSEGNVVSFLAAEDDITSVIDAGAGNDAITITAEAVVGSINAGAGNDVITIDGSVKTVSGGDGDDKITLNVITATANGNKGNDIVTGDARIRGGQGDDQVKGGDGSGEIYGDKGNDKITGGLGADTFYFKEGDGNDFVLDYNFDEGDRIALKGIDINLALELAVENEFGHVELKYNDLNEDGTEDKITLVGVNETSLTAEMFIQF